MMRFKIRNLFYVVCGAALMPACGDDSGSQDGGETETEGDEEDDDSDGDASVTLSTTVNPDSTGPDPTDDDTTASTVDDSTTGGPCLLPEEIFEDPSFEAGDPWGQASDAFGTPLCTAACGDAAMASDGAQFAWFGGIDAPEVGGLAQTVTINPLADGEDLTLSFDFWIQSASTNPDDRFYITVDGTEIFSVTTADAADYTAYTQVDLDVTEYADGREHEFEFIGITYGGDPLTNFFLDNLRMGGCNAGEAVTVTDSVTGISLDEPIAMCDDDLGNTVPQTVMGTTVGQGDDSQPSCSGGTGGEEFVYSWTAPAAGTYQFDTLGSAADTVVYVYDACMDGMEIGCHDDVAFPATPQSIVTLTLEADQTVAIAVDSYDSTLGGDYELHISAVACDTPTDLGTMLPVSESDSTMGAGDNVTPSCVTEVGGEDVVYTWTAPSEGLYTFDTAGSSFPAVLALYEGACGNFADERVCLNDGMMNEYSTLLSADQSFSIVVDGATAADAGNFDLNIAQVPLAGDCCATDGTPGCEDFTITSCVCDLFPSCCSDGWDESCVGLAATQCEAGCAAIPGGSCCMEQAGTGCDTPAIQDCLCPIDPFCCGQDPDMMGTWDATCVMEATDVCNADCA